MCSSTSRWAENNNTPPLWPPQREMVEDILIRLRSPLSQYLVLQRKESSAIRSGGEGGRTQVSVQQKSNVS